MTPISVQSGCGSCVAFATVAAVEATLRVERNDPGLDVDYSEAHLFYCHARREGRTCDGPLTGGWWPEGALEAFRRNGVTDEHFYPYVAGDQSCSNLARDAHTRLTFVEGWRRHPRRWTLRVRCGLQRRGRLLDLQEQLG